MSMAMGKREEQQKPEPLWIAHAELAAASGHPFYEKLNELLDAERFEPFVEGLSAKFYGPQFGRPSLLPGVYSRSLLIGYFEGIEGERGIAWRVADSLGLRRFLGIGLTEKTPDHSTLSRTRRLIDLETHQQVFTWVLGLLADRGLLQSKRIGIDATTLEANAGVERCDAFDRAARQRRELQRVSNWTSQPPQSHRRLWQTVTQKAGRIHRTQLCPLLRNGRNATLDLTRA